MIHRGMDVSSMPKKRDETSLPLGAQMSISPSKTKSAGPVRVTFLKVWSPDFSKAISRVSPPSTSTLIGLGAPSPIKVDVEGGDTLEIAFEKSGDQTFKNVTLTGPADFVFEGEIDI